MWTYVIIILTIFHTSSSTLTGDNVCQEKETYKVNVTYNVIRNITVRSYIWCLRFPPRCTTFSVKQVNDEEIREEDGVRYNSVCCMGYEPDKDGNSCIATSRCTVNCVNGICDTESKCYCNPGYRGDDCSKACIANRWGRYCRYHCNCLRGTCDPTSGYCSCPPGWAGNSCKDACRKGTFGLNCTSNCNCQSNECNPIDGQCIYNANTQHAKNKNSTYIDNELRKLVDDAVRKLPRNDSSRTATLQKYHTFNIKMTNDTDSKAVDKTSTESVTKFSQADENHKSISSTTEIATTQGSKENPSVYWKAHNNFLLTLERSSNGTKSNIVRDNVTEGTPKLLRMKVLKSYEEDDSGLTSLNDMQPREEAYLDDGEIHKNISSRNGNLFFTIGAIAGLSLLLIGVLSLVLAIRRYKRISPTDSNVDDKEDIGLKGGNCTTMSVTTRSIFHTPLPDPPIINNPVFTTPIESSTTFATHVICNVNISNAPLPNKETAEQFYDHPPSTGSYRAVSHPEPPEKDRVYTLTNNISTGEPVYDEIPCWKPPESDCNQIYQNGTSGIYVNSIKRNSNQYK